MYALNPDLQWLAFSSNKGPWSIEAEESFERKLKMLNTCSKNSSFTSYHITKDFNLTTKQYNIIKTKIMGIKQKIKVVKFDGIFP